MKEFLNSPLGKKLSILAMAGLAATLSRYVPGWDKYVDLAAAFMAGGAIMRSPGDVKGGDA